jgi:hypothetical protein
MVMYHLGKLLMNGLYGKLCQKPIFEETRYVKSNAEFHKFFKTHKIKHFIELFNEVALIGEPREEMKEENSLTKPTHLASFVLAYSRRVMIDYMHKLNPYFDIQQYAEVENLTQYINLQRENDIFYTDTDSLQVKNNNAKNIQISNDELGLMSYDIPGKTIRGFYIQPKLYCNEYLIDNGNPRVYCSAFLHRCDNCGDDCLYKTHKCSKNKNKLCNGDIHIHVKGKGVPTDKLKLEHYVSMLNGEEIELTPSRDAMRRIGLKRNNKEQEYDPFSVILVPKENLTRTNQIRHAVLD